MSLSGLINNQTKPWLNARVNNITVDGTMTIPSISTGAIQCTSLIDTGTSQLEGQVTMQNSTNQLVFQPGGSGNTVSVNCLTPSASNVQTIYDTPSINSFFKMGVNNTKTITATSNLVGADSGKKIFISNAGSAYSITLIPVVNGLDFDCFIVGSIAAAVTFNITGGGALFDGIIVDASTSKVVQIANKTTVVVGTGANIGDTIKFVSNGTFYNVLVVSSSNAGITAPS
jgi:hypothetical protein